MFISLEETRTFYQDYSTRVATLRHTLNRPLTFCEKILFSHLSTPALKRGEAASLQVDRVAMQDATAQMAILQFMLTGREKTAVPTTIHCDHLIQASRGAAPDLQEARLQNHEVYQFLKSAANKYGMGFWNPGSGIIHQVILENYAVPGQLMVGTDSHTPNAGGLGMMAIGVGGADAVDVMAGLPWNIRLPKIIGIHLKGHLQPWTSPKDIILKVASILTVSGGTGYILEYFGDGAHSLSATGKATITNMGAEVGATTSIFPYDEKTSAYLRATNRAFITDLADNIRQDLQADPEVEANPLAYFDQYLEINLDLLEPQVVGPHTPDLARPVSQLAEEVVQQNWPSSLSACLIGSCTNSSYEDMTRAASVVRQAVTQGKRAAVPLLVTPGSEQIYQTMKRDGLLEIFEQFGATVLANACGPCIGQWKRADSVRNSIITSYNRNFKGRNDGNSETCSFIASPEVVVAFSITGRLDQNPLLDLAPPQGSELPAHGFLMDAKGYEAPQGFGEVLISPTSERLSPLVPFLAWKEGDFNGLRVLVKAKGKCTTDHISPAGKWLLYRGHLDKISDNLFSGVTNAFTEEVGKGRNVLSGEIEAFSTVAQQYLAKNQGWIAVGDENYGEGSSREHAAMEPRYLGCRAVIARSLARIAETNLKMQGVLPLWFMAKEDYKKVQEEDVISLDVAEIMPGKEVYATVEHADGTVEMLALRHTLSTEEIEWFKAGSKLEWIRKQSR